MRQGILDRADGRFVLRYQRRLAHPPEKVWRALIEPGQLAMWFPAAIEGERKQGARLRFVFEGEPGPPLEGEVLVFDPPRRLEYSWGTDLLRFELVPDGAGCVLHFSTTFDERANAARDGAGWHACLDALDHSIAHGAPPAPDAGRVPVLYRQYLEGVGLGDFPGFLTGGEVERDAWRTPGMDGFVFTAGDGRRLTLLRAGQDAEGAEHTSDGAYLLLIAGELTLRFAGEEFRLTPGQEFSLPPGVSVTTKVTAGTRLLHGVSG
jgi:uncharacterized protein YndB with AHSA1/START domain